jgi:hypothetical protein
VHNNRPAYVVDRRGRIARVNCAFDELARSHGRPDLGESVVGLALSDFVAGADVRRLWRSLLDQARTWPVPLRFHYRCDAPEMARLAMMELRPVGSDGDVELRSHFVQCAPRLHQRLFDANAERDERLLRSCAWCNRFYVGGWVPVEHAVETLGLLRGGTVPGVTHGICERCVDYLDDPSPDLAPDPPL